jgi:hypothetical protein
MRGRGLGRVVNEVKVGMIGYNEGNGHPFSFSAILNGYDPIKIEKCPYAAIPVYLSKRPKSDFGVENLKVTHVWCPDPEIANLIAECTYIPNVVGDYKEMLDQVDAIIIARDDYGSHLSISKYFLENDIPVFIDKPLCNKLNEMEFYMPYLNNGMLMSCSGLRYLPALVNHFENPEKINDVLWSHNISILDWFKYGIHVLESIMPIMGSDVEWVENTGELGNDLVRIQYSSGKFSLINVNVHTGFIIRSSFYTVSGNHFQVDYNDNFSCFKSVLTNFSQQLKTRVPAINPEETLIIIKTLCAAERSRNEGGRRIHLNEL